MKFFNIADNTSFQNFEQCIVNDEIIVQMFLPEDKIVSSRTPVKKYGYQIQTTTSDGAVVCI